jgi:hypothetical protein
MVFEKRLSGCSTAVLTTGFVLALSAGSAKAALPLQTSISKDGVTWTFDRPMPVGQFVNGDYYVVGKVTVTSIDPPPQTSAPYMNGSVKDLPTPNRRSSFDRRLDDGDDASGWFDPQWRAYAPVILEPGESLVSSISVPPEKYHKIREVMRAEDGSCSPVATVSILTVLSKPVAPDAFRPSYCDRKQTIYYAHDLDRNLLPSLAPPEPGKVPPLSQFEAWLRRPWIDLNGFLFDAPAEYMPSYGAHIALTDGYVALLLSLNFPPEQKVTLTNYFVQYGIDLFGCLQAGYSWPAFGGHRSGRKLPIVFAGMLLHNQAMQNVSSLYPDSFGEDMQTVYINQIPPKGQYQKAWQGATVIYGGHYGVHEDGTPVSAGLYGPYEQLQPKDWPILDPPKEQLGEGYRRCCTSMVWVGEALAMHILGAEGIWHHPAFFDYVDRWMTEDDAESVAAVKKQSGYDYTTEWDRQRQTSIMMEGQFPQNTFVDDMWRAYRSAQPHAPAITSARTAAGRVGDPFSAAIFATHGPASYSASGLPPGLSIDRKTGAISGTPTKVGTFTVKLSAANASGTGTATSTLTISD